MVFFILIITATVGFGVVDSQVTLTEAQSYVLLDAQYVLICFQRFEGDDLPDSTAKEMIKFLGIEANKISVRVVGGEVMISLMKKLSGITGPFTSLLGTALQNINYFNDCGIVNEMTEFPRLLTSIQSVGLALGIPGALSEKQQEIVAGSQNISAWLTGMNRQSNLYYTCGFIRDAVALNSILNTDSVATIATTVLIGGGWSKACGRAKYFKCILSYFAQFQESSGCYQNMYPTVSRTMVALGVTGYLSECYGL